MNTLRRTFLPLVAGAIVFFATSSVATAETYPARPARLIVGFAAGGGNDIVARIVAQWLSERTGAQFFVENRPGAATNIATETVVKARPDGYTLLLVSAISAATAALNDNLNFNFVRDIAPVAGIVSIPNVMVLNPSVPAKTIPEFISYAKANPGKLSMASAGTGSAGHVAGELFKTMTGVDLVHVSYRGNAPALNDVLGGHAEVVFTSLPPSLELIRTGKLRGLGVTSATRSEELPDLPTIGEFVPGYEMTSFGIGAPKGTPADVIDKLNKEINAGLADPKMRTRLSEMGGITIAASPSDFGRLIADESEKWAKVIRAASIKTH